MRAVQLRLQCLKRCVAQCSAPHNQGDLFARPFSTTASLHKFQLNLKQDSTTAESSTLKNLKGQEFSRAAFDALLRRRLFYTPAFEIYQRQQNVETKGLYDYGPPGCALQNNIIELFRKHFILEEDMLEIECTNLTPSEVLKTSGHVEKFSDWMCKDKETLEILRADHVIKECLEGRLILDQQARGQAVELTKEDDDAEIAKPPASEYQPQKHNKTQERRIKLRNASLFSPRKLDEGVTQSYKTILAQLDNYTGPELKQLMEVHHIVNPATGNKLSVPIPFNLMFPTTLGPLSTYGKSTINAYLRPETAQGQFANFAKLLEHNNNSMPFASASIGRSFRNEISPRGGLLRVREFLMAEIEHYVDPTSSKAHPRFAELSHLVLPLLSRDTQTSSSTDPRPTSLADAVRTNLIANETHAYFLARTHLFLLLLGANPAKLRYRQHLPNELAHYATDCWDAELLTSQGWIECVGLADRAAHDLTLHSARTGAPLLVREHLPSPIKTHSYVLDINLAKFGPRFRKDAPLILNHLNNLTQSDLAALSAGLDERGYITLQIPGANHNQGTAHVNHLLHANTVTLDDTFLTITQQTLTQHTREYVPGVIEPSFGIGRILYAVSEHVFWQREDDPARGVLSFPPIVAPFKVTIYPLLSNQDAFGPVIADIRKAFREKGLLGVKVDKSSGSIGKRYARSDELGTPWGITVDYRSLEDGTVTLRERDSTRQVRGRVESVVEAVSEMLKAVTSDAVDRDSEKKSWEDVVARFGLEKVEVADVDDRGAGDAKDEKSV